MEILVTYDVSTESQEGRRRLRRVAKLCEAYGQRVQYSVFEAVLSAVQLEQLMHRLATVIDPKEDSLRIYRLAEPRERYVQVLGREQCHDIHDPLIF